MKINSVLELGNLIKQRRHELNITQADAAEICNVGKRFFSELENGKENGYGIGIRDNENTLGVGRADNGWRGIQAVAGGGEKVVKKYGCNAFGTALRKGSGGI